MGTVAAIAGYLLVPMISQQVQQLAGNYNAYLNSLYSMALSGQQILQSWGVRQVDIDNFLNQMVGQAQSIGMGALNNTISLLQGLANFALQFILVVILSFYFMKDGQRIFGNMLRLLPPRWQDEAELVGMSIEKSFGGFIRGQLLFAIIYAVLTGIIMMAFGLDYVIIASMVSGLCMLIPLVGNFLAFAPPMLVCLVTPDKASLWLWLLLALFIMQSIQMNFIGPRVMSQAIGIHPLYVVAAMLVGGQVAGLWGALFGIPIAGAMNLIGRPMMRRIRFQVPLYREVQGLQLTTRQFTTGPLRASMVPEHEPDATQEVAVTTTTQTSSTVPSGAPALKSPVSHPVEHRHTPAYGERIQDWEDEEDIHHKPSPTLTGKLWSVALTFVARAYRWVGARAHPGTTSK